MSLYWVPPMTLFIHHFVVLLMTPISTDRRTYGSAIQTPLTTIFRSAWTAPRLVAESALA